MCIKHFVNHTYHNITLSGNENLLPKFGFQLFLIATVKTVVYSSLYSLFLFSVLLYCSLTTKAIPIYFSVGNLVFGNFGKCRPTQ